MPNRDPRPSLDAERAHCLRRAAEEAERAGRCACPEARNRHLQLARLYADQAGRGAAVRADDSARPLGSGVARLFILP